MKKLISIVVVLALAVAFAACEGTEPATTPAPTVEPTVEATLEPSATAEATLNTETVTMLSNIWAAFADDQKFAVAGGDEANSTLEGPGAYGVQDTEALDAILAVPADAAAYIDEAASLMHMMNANTFTAGAFHVTDAANQAAFVEALKTNVLNRQWMCGFPDTLVIFTIGDSYVVSAFGEATNIENLKTNITTAYADAVLAVEENLAA